MFIYLLLYTFEVINMPRGDRTGPEGLGSRTGRALGYCAGYNSPGFTRGLARGGAGFGFGRGRGRGFGRGFWRWRRDFWPVGNYPEPYYIPGPYPENIPSEYTKDDEKEYLENMVKGLEEELDAVKRRLQELSKEKKKSP